MQILPLELDTNHYFLLECITSNTRKESKTKVWNLFGVPVTTSVSFISRGFLILKSVHSEGNQILTGQFYQGNYGPPPGYCFDVMCADDPIVDAPQLQGFNIDTKVDQLVKFVKKQVVAQRHRNVMLLMGSDFHYTDANMIYTNIDKLMKAANSRVNCYIFDGEIKHTV